MGLMALNMMLMPPAPPPDGKDKQQADIKAPQEPDAEPDVGADPRGRPRPGETRSSRRSTKRLRNRRMRSPRMMRFLKHRSLPPDLPPWAPSIQEAPTGCWSTLTSQGAAVARIELNSPKFRDLEDRTGYLGHIVIDRSVRGAGCRVDVVGTGTPAGKAGLRPGDLIKAVDDTRVTGFHSLQEALAETKPEQDVRLRVSR